MTTTADQPKTQVSYGDLARLFLRMSVTAFGGPVAHIAMGEDEIVNRRGWLTRQEYLDLIAATNLIPGPNSTEVMIHVGYAKRGIPGAILAGACFIIPAALITLALVILYVNTGALPQADALLWGIRPVIVAIIAVAGYRLIPEALKNTPLRVIFVAAALTLFLTDLPEVVVMVGAGVLYALSQAATGFNAALIVPLLITSFAPAAQAVINAGETTRAGLSEIFWYFLRIGSVLFGSGYVLFTYIQQDVVDTFGWLTAGELLDMIAIGQFTPGPVLTTTTAIGYVIAGLPGAVVATFAIFLPSFVLVILTAPLIPVMRRSRVLSAFLTGANTGVVAAILVTLVALAGEALRPFGGAPDAVAVGSVTFSLLAIVLFVASLFALIRLRLNATWVVIGGALAGLVFGAVTGAV